MALVSLQTPWWRRMLRRWWEVESLCCLWAQPCSTKTAYECRWCGRVMWFREWNPVVFLAKPEPVEIEFITITVKLSEPIHA